MWVKWLFRNCGILVYMRGWVKDRFRSGSGGSLPPSAPGARMDSNAAWARRYNPRTVVIGPKSNELVPLFKFFCLGIILIHPLRNIITGDIQVRKCVL